MMKRALGVGWNELAPGVKAHYDLDPSEEENLTLKGLMNEVYHSRSAKLFILFGRVFGALVPYCGTQIPTVVRNWTRKDDRDVLHWHRTLNFPNRTPVTFSSRMVSRQPNEIIEFVRYGMGIRMSISVVDHALVYRGIDYVWIVAGRQIHLPNWLILGDAIITEKALSETCFQLNFEINHPWLGKTFSYCGEFSLTAVERGVESDIVKPPAKRNSNDNSNVPDIIKSRN
ncbi:MAG: DUF4166 domain-containing protein [Candidatus Thiodiazotropha sp.]